MKTAPSLIEDSVFAEVPDRLRATLATMIGARPAEIALTNSTSYGFNLLAQGLPWREGDEILCVSGDFPATIVPWLPLEQRGVRVRLLEVPGARVNPDQLTHAIGPKTRAVCLSWVFSFFGHAIDLETCGQICHERGSTSSLTARRELAPVRSTSRKLPFMPCPAAASNGLRPYATGFIWLSPQILERLDYPQPHWLRLRPETAAQTGVTLKRELDYSLHDVTSASSYDIFCTANFLNYMPWDASLQHLLEFGVDQIERHDQALVEQLITGLPNTYELLSPRALPARSTLVLISHVRDESNESIAHDLQLQGIVALRDSKLRIAPHLYNCSVEIDRILEVLAQHP
jgi:cysteine desulfurase/selenocysteine lyase